MFNNTIAETVNKYIELNKIEKLYPLLRGKDLTAISLVAIADLFSTQYGYPIEELKSQGAIVEVQQLIDTAKSYLQKIQTEPELTEALASLKRGLIQLMQFWRAGTLKNKAAEDFLNNQAIEIMQSSSLNIKVVDSYIHEHMQKQLQDIYQQWLAGNEDKNKDLLKGAETVVVDYIHTQWSKKDSAFDQSIKDRLTANVHELLLHEYQQGELQSAKALEAAMVNMLLELVAKKALVQFPELSKHIDDLNTISTKGSSELNMIPVYTESFQKVIADCKSGKTGGPIAKAIQRFVTEGIKNIELPADELSKFEKAAVHKLLAQFKQNSGKAPETLSAVIEKTILDYLEMQCSENQEMGNAIKTTVIKVLLVEWKQGKAAELGKAVESIIMQDCKTLIQQIDNRISSAVMASKVIALEQKAIAQEQLNDKLINILAKHGIVVNLSELTTDSVADATTFNPGEEKSTVGKMLGQAGIFASKDFNFETSENDAVKTTSSLTKSS